MMLNSLRKLPTAEASADSTFPPATLPLGYPSETNDIRAALRPARPALSLPRREESRSDCPDLRLFCEPFADFLYDTVPNRRRPGQIPRSVLRPLWRLLHVEHQPHPVGLTEVISLIQRAERDPSFAEEAASRHPDFWNIVDDIRAALVLEDRFRDTRDHLRAAAVAGCFPHWLMDHLAGAVAGLSAADPKAADLFVMLVARHRPVARTALEMLGRLADHPATRSHVSGLIDRLAEDVRSRAMAAVPDRGPADPAALEAAVRDLAALKLTAGRLPQATLPFARLNRVQFETHGSVCPIVTLIKGRNYDFQTGRGLEADMIRLLTDRFLPEGVERVLRLTPADPTDLRRPDTRRLAAALACLARSRRLFQALGVTPDYDKALIALTGAVSRRLGDLALIAARLPAEERRTALATLDETLGVLHLIAPQSRLRPVRDHIEDLTGEDLAGAA
jgi:hypothetical protein